VPNNLLTSNAIPYPPPNSPLQWHARRPAATCFAAVPPTPPSGGWGPTAQKQVDPAVGGSPHWRGALAEAIGIPFLLVNNFFVTARCILPLPLEA
jgi:hypothetical protein